MTYLYLRNALYAHLDLDDNDSIHGIMKSFEDSQAATAEDHT